MKNLKHYLIFILLCFFISCSFGTGSGIGTNNIGGGTTDTEADTLSDTETDLYESDDSAMSIPVTIAKLESVNIEKTTVYQEITAVNPSQTAYSVKYSQTDDYDTYHIVGEAGAVNTEQNTNSLMLVNGDNFTQFDVNADGSFDATIYAIEGDPVAMIPVNEDNQGAPPVLAQKENTITTYSFTNSDNINIYQTPIIDRGYYYFSMKTDDDLYNLYRRNIDGTFVQIISESLDAAPRVITTSENHDVILATQDGKVYYIAKNTAESTTEKDMLKETTLSFASSTEETSHEWKDPVEIYDFEEPLNLSSDAYSPVNVNLFFSDINNAVVITNKKQISADSTQDQEYLMHYYDIENQALTDLLESDNFNDPIFVAGSGEIIYAFLQPANAGKAALYRLMSSNGVNLWNSAALMYEHEVGAWITSMTASGKGTILFVDNKDGWQRFYQTNTQDDIVTATMFYQEDLSSDQLMTPWLTISWISQYENSEFVTCITDTTSTDSDILIYSQIHSGVMDDVYVVANGDYSNSCAGYYTMDDDSHMIFYRGYRLPDGSMGKPQVSIFDVTTLDPDLLPIKDDEQ